MPLALFNAANNSIEAGPAGVPGQMINVGLLQNPAISLRCLGLLESVTSHMLPLYPLTPCKGSSCKVWGSGFTRPIVPNCPCLERATPGLNVLGHVGSSAARFSSLHLVKAACPLEWQIYLIFAKLVPSAAEQPSLGRSGTALKCRSGILGCLMLNWSCTAVLVHTSKGLMHAQP